MEDNFNPDKPDIQDLPQVQDALDSGNADKSEAGNTKQITVNLSMPFLKNLTGWATFVAVIDIIVGALSCLSFILVIPAVFGVFKILSGVKLLGATDELKKYMSTNQLQKLTDVFYNFNKYFKFSGISIIIQIVLIILIVALYIAAIVFFVSNPGFFENLENFTGPGYY